MLINNLRYAFWQINEKEKVHYAFKPPYSDKRGEMIKKSLSCNKSIESKGNLFIKNRRNAYR
jgi:hypothetical protein